MFLPTLAQCHSIIINFDLCMSKGGHDIFTLVINFFGVNWQPKHITLGFFEATNFIGQTLIKILTNLLDTYELRKKIITYVKDEGFNFNTMTIALKLVVSCDMFGLEEIF